MIGRRLAAVMTVGLTVVLIDVTANGQTSDTLQSQQPPTAGVVVMDDKTIQAAVGGWSAKNQVLGKDIINDASPPATIGTVSDIIIDKGAGVSYAIVDVGGFLGIGKKQVLVPVARFTAPVAGKFVFPGVTKDMMEAAPAFKYEN